MKWFCPFPAKLVKAAVRPCGGPLWQESQRLIREIIEDADVMKQWTNPCVREAYLDWVSRRGY